MGNYRTLGPSVNGMLRRAREAMDGSNVADCPPSARQHVLGNTLSEEKLRSDVNVIETIELLLSNRKKRLVEADARIVNQTVYTAEKFYCLGTQSDDLLDPVEIRLKSFTPQAHSANLGYGRSRTYILVDVMHHDIRALPGKL